MMVGGQWRPKGGPAGIPPHSKTRKVDHPLWKIELESITIEPTSVTKWFWARQTNLLEKKTRKIKQKSSNFLKILILAKN